jgi:predicted ribosome quality control (RQC) complex YloA/Tae2 family protein
MTDYTVGKSAQNNWDLLDKAKGTDIWFHLDSFSSPYVILNTENAPNKNDILECAIACKSNSKFKNIPKLKIVYCPINNLTKGDKVGSVIIKSYRKCNYVII